MTALGLLNVLQRGRSRQARLLPASCGITGVSSKAGPGSSKVTEGMLMVSSSPHGPSMLRCQLRAPKAHVPGAKAPNRAVSSFMASSSWVVTKLSPGSRGGNTDINHPSAEECHCHIAKKKKKKLAGTGCVDMVIFGKHNHPNLSFFHYLECFLFHTIHQYIFTFYS